MIKYEPPKGENFFTSVRKIKELLHQENQDYLDFEFNGIRIKISVDSNIDDLNIIYLLKHKIRQLETI